MGKYFRVKKEFFIFICIFFVFQTASFSKEKIELDSKLESKIKKEIKLFPYDSNLKFSLADLYVNYLLKIENKNYEKKEIENKMKIIEYNLSKACELEKESFCDYSYLTLFLKNKFNILNKSESEKFNQKAEKTKQLLSILEAMFKNNSSLEDLESSIEILDNVFEISGNNKEIGEFYINTLNNYKKVLHKENNNKEIDAIINRINKKSNSNKNKLFDKRIETKELLNDLFFRFLKDELFDITCDELNRENIAQKIKEKYTSNNVKELETLLEDNKDNAVFISELGLYNANLGKIDDGITLIKKAININPSNYMNFYKLALVYNLKNNDKFTINNLNECIKLKPVFVEYIINDEHFEKLKNSSDFESMLENSEILKMKNLKMKNMMDFFGNLQN